MNAPPESLDSPAVAVAPVLTSPRLVTSPVPGALTGEFTARSLVGGCAIGALLAITNVYMGLKTGWWESGSIIAAVLGFSGLTALGRRWGGGPSMLETNLTQTTASAVGAMPAVAGLLGSIPALTMMGLSVPAWGIVVWSATLGVLGVLAAYLLRSRLLDQEGLAFPTGVATAELITALHRTGRVERPGRAQVLLGSGLFTMAMTWLRDVQAWVPAVTGAPGRLAGLPASTFTLGIGWSPMLMAVGMMAGLQMSLSMVLGALVSWVAIAPELARAGSVDSHLGYDGFSVWLTWPGVGLMVGAAVVSLAAQARSLLGAAAKDLRSLGSAEEPSLGRWAVWTGVGASVLTLVLGRVVFGLPVLHTLLALALVLPLCAVCARGAGQMDISPVSQMGQLTQVASGTVFPGPTGLNVAAGSVVAGAVAQTGVSLWSYKAGHLLKSSPARQMLSQMLGVLVGSLVSVPVYLLLVDTYGLGEALPVPSAHQFRIVASVSIQGLEGLPPYAARAAAIGFFVGAGLTLAARGRLERLVPSAVAMGLGMLLPAHYAITIGLGALLVTVARRVRPDMVDAHMPALGAGAIAGESIMGLLIAALVALELIQRPG
ncbi:OPT/YSL family transporter [Stigmatella aurantiaca]|nr:OPT family oligopeptide transporter [Stigmatella aurantiaca]